MTIKPPRLYFGKNLRRELCVQIEVIGYHGPEKVPVQPPFYAELCKLARGSARTTIEERIQDVFREASAEILAQDWLARKFECELRLRTKAKLRVSYSEERALEFDSKTHASGETVEKSHSP